MQQLWYLPEDLQGQDRVRKTAEYCCRFYIVCVAEDSAPSAPTAQEEQNSAGAGAGLSRIVNSVASASSIVDNIIIYINYLSFMSKDFHL